MDIKSQKKKQLFSDNANFYSFIYFLIYSSMQALYNILLLKELIWIKPSSSERKRHVESWQKASKCLFSEILQYKNVY